MPGTCSVPPHRLLRSVTFRLALVYAGLFAVSAVLLLVAGVYIVYYWMTSEIF